MTTREDIKNLMAYMILAFPNYHPALEGGTNTVDVLFDLLSDLPIDTLKTAVKACCAEPGRAFAPSAGEIRGAVAKMDAAASGLKSAGEAWQEVMDYIRGNGCHGAVPEFSHPAIKKAVQAIGLEEIGMSEDVMVERAHFLKIYADLSQRAMSEYSQLPQVTAYIENQRQITGAVHMLEDKWTK